MSETEQIVGGQAAGEGVLLLFHGGPSCLEEVPVFLEALSGRSPSAETVERVTEKYRLIGGSSPAPRATASLASALARATELPVYRGTLHGRPPLEEAVSQMAADGLSQILAICLIPHYSSLGVGKYRARAEAAAATAGLRIRMLDSWHTEPAFIGGLADGIAALLQRQAAIRRGEKRRIETAARVVFTAHSLPRAALGPDDPYERQVRETTELVAARLGLAAGDWTIAYQGAVGNNTEWLGPSVREVLASLAAEGTRRVIVCPAGFVLDQVETLYDLDILLQGQAREMGIELLRIPALNDNSALVDTMAALVRGLRSEVEKEWRDSPSD